MCKYYIMRTWLIHFIILFSWPLYKKFAKLCNIQLLWSMLNIRAGHTLIQTFDLNHLCESAIRMRNPNRQRWVGSATALSRYLLIDIDSVNCILWWGLNVKFASKLFWRCLRAGLGFRNGTLLADRLDHILAVGCSDLRKERPVFSSYFDVWITDRSILKKNIV